MRNILQGLEPEEVERAFRSYTARLAEMQPAPALKVVAIDGKTLKHSFDHLNDCKAAHVLSAFTTETHLILGHLAVDDKTNEIPAAQRLIRELGLTEHLFTLDAMHCQKKTFEAASETGNYILVQVKENQPSLLDRAQQAAESQAPIDSASRRDLSRNRQEDRTVDVFSPGDHLAGTHWDGVVAAIIRVERETLRKSSKTGLYTTTSEVAYYVSSTADLTAQDFAHAIRGHWGIENRDHYVRDVTLAEDASRIRTNPGIMARARSFALNILRASGVDNVAQATWENALNLNKLLSSAGLV